MRFDGVAPRGLLARLRSGPGRRAPAFVRGPASKLLRLLASVRGTSYNIAGHHLRFIPGSEPVAVIQNEMHRLDAFQLVSFARAIRPGDVVADVGAHRGTYTITAAACTGPTGRVHSFEPVAANTRTIHRNLSLNRLNERVEVVQSAVSDRTGSVEFFAYGDSSSNSMMLAQENADAVIVPSTSLDDYFKKRPLPRVVKIDVEGAEFSVLRGATRILESDAEIICELHPFAWHDALETGDALRALLRNYNRELLDLETLRPFEEMTYGVALLRRRG